MKIRSIALLLTMLGCLNGCTNAPAAGTPEAAKPKIGSSGPAWKELLGTDDAKHSLADLKASEVVVVCFTCNHCPVAKAYEDRLIAFDKDYRDKAVTLVAINVNNLEEDKLPAMKKRAEEKKFAFDYLYDPTQQIGRDYNAKVTPHTFVLDKDRKIAYMGAIDDSQNEKKVKERYLRNAVDALLAGKTPDKAVTRQIGCSIKYE